MFAFYRSGQAVSPPRPMRGVHSADSCDNPLLKMRTRISISLRLDFAIVLLAIFAPQGLRADNLVANPSFELVKNRDQFGGMVEKWGGYKYEGDCSFEVGDVPHSGKTSALLLCSSPGKIRISQPQDLEPGRYRVTAYIRGLDIGTGQRNSTTEFMFDDKYFPLKKNGVFGWTLLTYVADLSTPKKTGPSFGLFAPGYLWVDDVSMERVGRSEDGLGG